MHDGHMSSTDTPATPTAITVAIDMEADLVMAGAGPRFDRADELEAAEDAEDTAAVEEIEAAHRAEVARLTALWTDAAIRIGAERGFAVEVTADLGRRTSTPAGDDGDTVEREIWQAAHDAIA